ncbi:MAG TPA: GAF domain-containing protein [Trebonia sp.]|jgi:transcriptional regulator of acetoin/glycerol metabolism|nr:GAF domain-containing protein [Trebonia sp.]
MGRASTRLYVAGDRLAAERDRFLAAQPVNPETVRAPILASWWRSRGWNVAADRLDLNYLRDPDLESALARGAEPVLKRLHEQLSGQPISVILTDAAGLVLLRLTGDRDLERHLDSIMLAPGFSYAEDTVGTNGIGTALESGGPAHVFGHEHYAEHLEGMACAGIPVRDPVSGKTVGVLDLTCWRKDADPLLISLAQVTASEVGQAMAAVTSSRDMHLLQEYQRACRHSGGIVLALGHDIAMLNDHARQALTPADQAALITRASDVLARPGTGYGASGSGAAVTVDLPSGTVARMFCRNVSGDLSGSAPCADGVVHVKIITSAMPEIDVPAPRAPGTPPLTNPMTLPGLVGGSAAWRRACREAEASYDSGEWLTLEGEKGAGKLALIRAVHQRRDPAAPFHVVDLAYGDDWLADVRRDIPGRARMLVIRHVDSLTAKQARALAGALQEIRSGSGESGLRVAATLDRSKARADLTAVLRFFPATVDVPALRHHADDVPELVPFFLARLSQHGRVTCSPQAMQLLLRHNWPGNAAQLWDVLKQVVQRRRAGAILPQDLPPECWTVSRRVLSPLESMERDAIVQSLRDHGGNKIGAARALGMSRATIYRRIHEYGIITTSG